MSVTTHVKSLCRKEKVIIQTESETERTAIPSLVKHFLFLGHAGLPRLTGQIPDLHVYIGGITGDSSRERKKEKKGRGIESGRTHALSSRIIR